MEQKKSTKRNQSTRYLVQVSPRIILPDKCALFKSSEPLFYKQSQRDPTGLGVGVNLARFIHKSALHNTPTNKIWNRIQLIQPMKNSIWPRELYLRLDSLKLRK